jgi:hypothetical protein
MVISSALDTGFTGLNLAKVDGFLRVIKAIAQLSSEGKNLSLVIIDESQQN